MDSLFLEKKQFEKVATTYVDKDSTTWVKSVITEFLSEYPQLQNQPLGVQWKKKDTTKGYAVGSINVMGGNVPVIINNFQVSPFDVIMFGNAAMPLNPDTLQEMMTQADAFRGATNVQPKSALQIFGDSRVQFSPVDTPNRLETGASVTRDAVKVASFIDNLEHVDKDAVKEIFKQVQENDLLSQFEANGTAEVLEKLANHSLVSSETALQSFLRELDIDRQYVFTDNLGNKFVKQANSSVDYVWTTELEGSEDEKSIFNAENHTKVAEKSKNKKVKDVKAGECGHFEHNGEKTAEFDIVEIEKVEKLKKFAFLVNEDGNYAICVEKDGKWAEVDPAMVKKAAFDVELEGTEPNLGDYGIFVVNNKTTKPFEIVEIVKTAGFYEVKGLNNEGLSTYMPIRVKNDGFWPKEHEKLAFYVPGNAKFIKLSKKLENSSELEKIAQNSSEEMLLRVKVVENLTPKVYYLTGNENSDFSNGFVSSNAEFVQDEAEKIAYTLEGNDFVGRDNAGLYFIGGDNFSMYAKAHSDRDLSKDDAVWAAIHCGANENDVEKIASLKHGQSYYISNKLSVPVTLNEIASKVNDEYEKIAKVGQDFAKILVKEAAVLPDKSTVDAVLSLGLMKKYNIMEYIALIPNYEQVVGELCKLLMMVRLGLTNLPEAPVKTAMEALTTTLILLRQLQKVNK